MKGGEGKTKNSGDRLFGSRGVSLTHPSCLSGRSVQFRTTPMDSTGVPHVLEHTVLCGSQKYPCRDPFFKMLNRSLSTFMNAFTGKTHVWAGTAVGSVSKVGRACGWRSVGKSKLALRRSAGQTLAR